MSNDLFAGGARPQPAYDASSIEVLEGLEPVRRRPGMYIGGTDERALHHLAAEVLDNAMDEAVAGHATRIEVKLEPGNRLTRVDNGRGIPVDPHPKFPDKSALEVILSTLHSGGKFTGKAYATSGGLHGVGISVVNALSSDTVVEVARERILYRQRFAKGATLGPLETVGAAPNRRGTSVAFTPDTEIFGPELHFKPALFAALVPPLPGIRVQPVRIDYGTAAHDLAWLGTDPGDAHAKRVLRRRGRFTVTLHYLAPFDPAAFPDRKAIAAEARRGILDT